MFSILRFHKRHKINFFYWLTIARFIAKVRGMYCNSNTMYRIIMQCEEIIQVGKMFVWLRTHHTMACLQNFRMKT